MLAHCSKATHDRIFPKKDEARKKIIAKYGETSPVYCDALLKAIDNSLPIYRFDWSIGGWKRRR